MNSKAIKIPGADHPITITYEAPYAAVSTIREYLAFYPDRVDAIEVSTGANT